MGGKKPGGLGPAGPANVSRLVVDAVHASALNRRRLLQQAVRYVTGRIVVRPSILVPPDITKSDKNSGYEPTRVERVGCTSILVKKNILRKSNEQSLGAW